MNPENKIISDVYKDLLAQYGELVLRQKQTSAALLDLESKLESLNYFQPVIVKIRQELERKVVE